MTDLERLRAARDAALDVAYAAWEAAVDAANAAYRDAARVAYHAALAAQEKETDQGRS
jgi:hypothetical protein